MPPIAVTDAAPVGVLHLVGVVVGISVMAVGDVISTVSLAIQRLLSVMVQMYVPAHRLSAVAVVCAGREFQWYV